MPDIDVPSSTLLAPDALSGVQIALSASESPDLLRLGLLDTHFRLALAETARSVLVGGERASRVRSLEFWKKSCSSCSRESRCIQQAGLAARLSISSRGLIRRRAAGSRSYRIRRRWMTAFQQVWNDCRKL